MKPSVRPRLHIAIDIAVLLILFAAVTVTFGPVFGGWRYLLAGIGGAALGIGIGMGTSFGPLRGWLTAAAGIVLAFVLFGVPLAVPSKALWGVLPSLEGLRDLLLGAVFSWKEVLTAEPPIGAFEGLLTVPYLTMLICATVATGLAMRLRRAAGWTLLPVLIALAVGIVFGTKTAALPWLVGAAVAVVGIAWLAWRMHMVRVGLAEETELEITDVKRLQRRSERNRLLGATAMLAAAALVSSAAAFVIDPSDRSVLRDVVEPPVEVEDYPSPLAGYRGWIKNHESDTLMTVEGMPEGSRLRIATMDFHDGEVYAVASTRQSGSSGSYTRIGSEITVDGDSAGEPADVRVSIENYSGIWLPTAGRLQALHFEGDRSQALQSSLHYNRATDSAITTQGLAWGDQYGFEALVTAPPTTDQLRGVPLIQADVPKAAKIPDLLAAWVATHSEGSTTLETIQSLQLRMQAGAFSHGLESDAIPSIAGHSNFRMDRMFSPDVLVGDDEQYAVAFALAMQQIGVPARVVMGLYPDDGFGGPGAVELEGSDMHAWVEIPFEGFGWVPFDATPPEDNTEIEPEPEPQPEPKPQVLQPPQPPEEAAELTPEVQPEEGSREDEIVEFDWLPIIMAVAISLLALLLLLSPFLIIGLMKFRRRKRRRTAQATAARLSGGWHEVVDQAVDLGLDVPAGVTRTAVATTVAQRYPKSHAVDIGWYVDQGVFGPDDPPAEEVDAFWSDVEQSVKAMRGEASRWERFTSRLSVRSFMRQSRSRRSRR